MLNITIGKIDSRKMEPLKIHEKKAGGWWVTKVKEEPKGPSPRSPVKQKSMSNLLSSSTITVRKAHPPLPVRSNTTTTSLLKRSNTITVKKLPPTPPDSNAKSLAISVKSPAIKGEEEKTIDTSKLSISPWPALSF